MDWLFNGLPIHVLLVHFVVIVVPLTAICLVLSTFWPAARRRLGLVTPILALVALISVPITTQAGEALEEQVSETALSELHTELGDTLLPWAIALFIIAALQWFWFAFCTGDGRYAKQFTSKTIRTTITMALSIAVIAVAIGSVVVVVIIGESGARAVWDSKLG
ncbi:hypothetical protein FHX49_000820 [Microbacterium endophyticum]|uniref:DUF2231 domain-containing protein n=1 Tax=Microbacterium endophyticum TaxID=1526412 RepID=A0A7W4V1Y9_9MICO|nr:DUF2231 domain-containing protein [Microbacterium endophyticum]MBB2975254.1 hypothetical protein [Microbacterium endophyticum]NIK35727.1 hypothetical protein [Microbacterium endophyticum]